MRVSTKAATHWNPTPKLPLKIWLERYYRLPEEGADLHGEYNPDLVPALWGVMYALSSDTVKVVVLKKAAQVGWTYLLIGWLFSLIHQRPSPMLVLFPKEGTAREFSDEKLTPSIKATPVISRVIETKTRKDGNRALFKKFWRGFLKLIGSNSVSNVKSTPAPIVVVEEPDDTNEDVKGQGDAIRLAWERLKRFRRSKLVLGGTPSVEGISRVDEFLDLSTQRVLPIACHECGAAHVLDFEHVVIPKMDSGGVAHPVYGLHRPEEARYACPHCGVLWDDWRLKDNILRTVQQAADAGDPWCGWQATVDIQGGIEGFKELSELYTCLPGAGLADLAMAYLAAEHDAKQGDESGRIVFVNAKQGRSYRYKDDQSSADELRQVARDYAGYPAPLLEPVLTVTAGIDVQPDRLAVIIRGWGRGEESWLHYWDELHAAYSVIDTNDAVWTALDTLMFTPLAHATGVQLRIEAITIDSSDGNTNDAVYHWVRTRSRKHRGVQIMAGKGSSELTGIAEIFRTPAPKSIDHTNPKKQTKADRYGLKVYSIGTTKAKDWLNGQLKLEAAGRGKFHFYDTVRADYFEQITSEVKAPKRSERRGSQVGVRKVYQLKSGRRNEGLDGECYALHAARALKIHLRTEAQWTAIEQSLRQHDLFAADDGKPAETAPTGNEKTSDMKEWLT